VRDQAVGLVQVHALLEIIAPGAAAHAIAGSTVRGEGTEGLTSVREEGARSVRVLNARGSRGAPQAADRVEARVAVLVSGADGATVLDQTRGNGGIHAALRLAAPPATASIGARVAIDACSLAVCIAVQGMHAVSRVAVIACTSVATPGAAKVVLARTTVLERGARASVSDHGALPYLCLRDASVVCTSAPGTCRFCSTFTAGGIHVAGT